MTAIPETRLCEHCKQELQHGNNIHATQEGILGQHGFIPLEDRKLHCSKACVSNAYNQPTSHGEHRIP